MDAARSANVGNNKDQLPPLGVVTTEALVEVAVRVLRACVWVGVEPWCSCLGGR